jgi:GxxExxY protein
MTERERLDKISGAIIGVAIDVHRALGPGLLESAYEACLAYDLAQAGWAVEVQKPLPLIYRGLQLDCGYRLDLLVAGQVIVEVKAVDRLAPIHHAQLLSYLKLSGCKLGLLINFNVVLLKHGLVRLVHQLDETDSPTLSPSPRTPRAPR